MRFKLRLPDWIKDLVTPDLEELSASLDFCKSEIRGLVEANAGLRRELEPESVIRAQKIRENQLQIQNLASVRNRLLGQVVWRHDYVRKQNPTHVRA